MAAAGPIAAARRLIGATGQDDEKGVRIIRVQSERAAEKAGVEEGDVIQCDRRQGRRRQRAACDRCCARSKSRRQARVQGAARRQAGGVDAHARSCPAPAPPAPRGPTALCTAGSRPTSRTSRGRTATSTAASTSPPTAARSWTRINSLNPRPMYFSQVRVDPTRRQVPLRARRLARTARRTAARRSPPTAARGVHADRHALWIDPQDGRHMIIGTDGGFYVDATTAMDNWDHLNHMAIGQFYHVAVDNRQPYWVYGGLQDNGSWGGPTHGLGGGAGQRGLDLGRRRRRLRLPRRSERSRPRLLREPERRHGPPQPAHRRARLASRPRTVRGQRYRFNWNTPFILSNHNPGHLLRRRQLRLPLGEARRRPQGRSRRRSRGPGAARARRSPNRRETPTCSGSAPTTATSG